MTKRLESSVRKRLRAAAEAIARGKNITEAAAVFGVSLQTFRKIQRENKKEWDDACAAVTKKLRRSKQPLRSLLDICQQEYFPLNLRVKSSSTIYQYQLAIREFGEFLGRSAMLDDLTDDTLTLWIRHLQTGKRAAPTIREMAGRISALWSWLAKRREVDAFPTFIKPDVPQSMPQALTDKQLTRLFQSAAKERGEVAGIPAGLWWSSFLAFVWNTGERKGAAMAVKVEWLDFDRQQVTIPPGVRKGGKKWGVYALWPETIPVLRAVVMIDPARELVWPIDYCHESYYTRYNRILRDAGIPVSRKYKTHALRCTHATMKAALGGDATRALGHSDPATTQRYYIDPTMMPKDDVKMFIPWHQAAAVPTITSQPAIAPERKRPSIAAEIDAMAFIG